MTGSGWVFKPLVSGRCGVRKSDGAPCWGDVNALYLHCDGCSTAVDLWWNSSNCLKNSLVHWDSPETIKYSGMCASPGSRELRVTQRPESVSFLGGEGGLYASLEPCGDLSSLRGVLWILGEHGWGGRTCQGLEKPSSHSWVGQLPPFSPSASSIRALQASIGEGVVPFHGLPWPSHPLRIQDPTPGKCNFFCIKIMFQSNWQK